jgi:predicted nucleic acid-binding protein
MERVFVDTGGWYALTDRRDPDYEAAKAWFEKNTLPLVTTDYVLTETTTLIRVELGHRVAVQFGEELMRSARTQLVSVTVEDREAAWENFRKFKDQKFSFTDCTSFAVMKRLGMKHVLTVDKHFQIMDFILAI